MASHVFTAFCLCLFAYQASATFFLRKGYNDYGRYDYRAKCKTAWTEWSAWGPCSATCGRHNYKLRTRECYYVGYVNTNKDPHCHGSRWEEAPCNRKPCPTNGGWSNWCSWSSCSVSCGGGIRTRTRRCDNPEPSYGGKSCHGHHKQIKKCNNHACPHDRYYKIQPQKVFSQQHP